MRTRLEWAWEALDATTCRAKVYGGWVVQMQASSNKGSVALTSCFVSDPQHSWAILLPQTEVEQKKGGIPVF